MNEKKSKKFISIMKSISKALVNKYVICVLIICVFVGLFVLPAMTKKEYEQEIDVTTTIEKIVNKSELSTFQVIYNGIAVVNDKDNSKNISYYVSYKAKTKAGFNFEELDYKKNIDTKEIIITIPKITLQEPVVEIESLEYMFYDTSKDTLGVTEEAYKACQKDVKDECAKENAIYELAKENAVDLLTAIVEPFVEEIGNDYKLIIK